MHSAGIIYCLSTSSLATVRPTDRRVDFHPSPRISSHLISCSLLVVGVVGAEQRGNGVPLALPACSSSGGRRRLPPPAGQLRRRRRGRELQHERCRGHAVGQRQGHLVRPAQRCRAIRQRRRLRLQEREPVPFPGHDLVRQPASVPRRQGLRLLLQDPVLQARRLLGPHRDGGDHRHELHPRGGALPLRPQRHRLRQARQARPQRRAPPRRHHRHPVRQGALRVPGPQDRIPRRGGLQPGLLRRARRVRERRRRRGAGGPHGEGIPPVDAHARVLGIHLAPRLQPPPAAALLHPHAKRLRQDAGGTRRHPTKLEAKHILQIHCPVLVNKQLN